MAEVTYSMEAGAPLEAFSRDFPHLLRRIKQLFSNFIGYFLRGDIDCLVSAQFQADGLPALVAARFDSRLAARYEKFMDRFFEKASTVVPTELPRPNFPVCFTVNYGRVNAEEEYVFAFQNYGREEILKFCAHLQERATYYFRHRHSPDKP